MQQHCIGIIVVAYKVYIVAVVEKRATNKIGHDVGAEVPDLLYPVDGRATLVDRHYGWRQGSELLLVATKGIKDLHPPIVPKFAIANLGL